MRCEQCGNASGPHEELFSTTRDIQVDDKPSSAGGAPTRTYTLWLCGQCAASRQATAKLMMSIPVAIITGLLVIALLTKIFR